MKTQSWTVWHLAPEDEHGNEIENPGVIITTEDGETEITGLIHDPQHAPLIAAAPELLEALKDALEALEGFLPEDYSSDKEPYPSPSRGSLFQWRNTYRNMTYQSEDL
jgi:hypothetical protein